MLEPVLPEHLAEFRRLRRHQLGTVVVGPMIFVLYAVLVAIPFQTPSWVDATFSFSLLGAAAVFVGVLEIRKFSVFRRDVLEREGS